MGAGRNVSDIYDLGFKSMEKSIKFDLCSGIWLYYVLGGITNAGAGAPYTHTIAEANTLPSMALHFQHEESVGKHIYTDLLGVSFKNLKLTMERGGKVTCEATIIGAKSIAGKDVAETARSTSTPDGHVVFTFAHVDSSAFSFLYDNVGTYISLSEIDTIEINIENELEYLNVFGDEYPNKRQYGKRDYSIKINFRPTSNLWYYLRKWFKVPKVTTQYDNTTITASFASAAGQVITVTSFTDGDDAAAADSLIGKIIRVGQNTGADTIRTNRYLRITDNGAITGGGGTITVDGDCSDLVAGDGLTILTGFYEGDQSSHNGIELVLQLTRPGLTSDYIKLTFSRLYVKDYPNKLITMENDKKELSVDMELANAPGGTLAVEVKDDLAGETYY